MGCVPKRFSCRSGSHLRGALSGHSTSHLRSPCSWRKLTHSRATLRNTAALIICLAAINLFLGFTVSSGFRDAGFYSCGRNSGRVWLSDRSQRFTLRWNNSHKVRNAVLYICVGTRHLPIVRQLVYQVLVCPDVIYHRLYDQLFSVPYLCMTHTCLKHLGSSHYVYAEFVIRTYSVVMSKRIKPAKPKLDGKVAVLVEPRMHPLYLYTIKQVFSMLDDDWALHLFVSSENEAFVRERLSISPGLSGENIIVQSLGDFGLDKMRIYGNRVQSAFSAHEAVPLLHSDILWFRLMLF